MKKLGSIVIIILLSALTGTLISQIIFNKDKQAHSDYRATNVPAQLANYNPTSPIQRPNYNLAAQGGLDFTQAAAVVTPAVVHIKTKSTRQPASYNNGSNPFRFFFGDDPFSPYGGQNPYGQGSMPAVSTGSGVIISSDGYIVTNNHVIKGGNEIEVTLDNNKSYQAKIVGTDPSTDIALIKIEDGNLPYLRFANSDNSRVGEWVLAVGNPFNLASTVTAGIISAKARNIGIFREQSAIESFIQTDAAVNPGNSGGALVNLTGELIGINTAIATNTGSFEGYSFAVPSNLVKKVIEDLKAHGVVQRAYLGVNIQDLNSELANTVGTDVTEGVYVSGIISGSGAQDAGIVPGDIILEVDGRRVKAAPELQEAIASKRPGESALIYFLREGKTFETNVTLKNASKNTNVIRKEDVAGGSNSTLGIQVEPVTGQDTNTEITNGLQITGITDGVIRNYTDIQEGFIITKINKTPVSSVSELKSVINGGRDSSIMIEGTYPNEDRTYFYSFRK